MNYPKILLKVVVLASSLALFAAFVWYQMGGITTASTPADDPRPVVMPSTKNPGALRLPQSETPRQIESIDSSSRQFFPSSKSMRILPAPELPARGVDETK